MVIFVAKNGQFRVAITVVILVVKKGNFRVVIKVVKKGQFRVVITVVKKGPA